MMEPFNLELLSKRELEVLSLIREGYSSKSIFDRLEIKLNTVKTHRKHIWNKLNIQSLGELFLIAHHV